MNATLLDSGPADPVASSAAANAAVPTAPPLVQPEISAATMAPNAVALTASTQAAAAESNAASAETSAPAAGVEPHERLSPIELEILSAMDSTQFGFMQLVKDEKLARKRKIAMKAVSFMERMLVERHQRMLRKRKHDSNNNGRKPLGPTEPETYCKLGHLHLLLEQYERALSAYQKYATSAPKHCWKNAAYLYGQGLVFYHYNAYRWATRVFQQVLYIQPGFPRANEIHLRLGVMAKVNNDFSSSLKHLQMAQVSSAERSFSLDEVRFHIAHLHEV